MAIKRPLLVAFFLFIQLLGYSQSPVRIQVIVTRPYPNTLHSFQSNPAQVVVYLTNTHQSTLDVQLIGSIMSDNGMGVRTKRNYRSSRPVTLLPLSTRPLTPEEISQLFDANSFDYIGVDKATAIRMNGLPEGDYQVCIQAVDYRTLASLSESQPLGCSNVFPVSALEPPVIIRPFPDDSIHVHIPQNIVFSWTLPPGAPPSTQYQVRIVELPDDQRNPFDVMRSARQPFFETTIMGAPTMLYGPAEPPLTPGRRYALMVTALDPFNNLVFRNNGRSEVVAFTYGRNEITQRHSEGPNDKPLPEGNIPRSVIAGKISWYFQSSEEKGSSEQFAYSVKDFSSAQLAESIQDPTAGPFDKTFLQAALNGTTPMASVSSSPGQGIVLSPAATLKTIGAGVIVEGGGKTGPILSFEPFTFRPYADRPIAKLSKAGTIAHPLIKTTVKVYAINGRTRTLVASGLTDEDGSFEIPFVNVAFYNPALGSQLSVHIDHPDFVLEESSISITNPDVAGRYDLGELKAIARTFRLSPKVVDEDNKEITTATVTLYRPVSFYDLNPNHRFEGVQRKDSTYTFDGVQYRKVGSIKHGQTMFRLFYSNDWSDDYLVKIEDRTVNPLTTRLRVTGIGGIQEQVQLITKTYSCRSKLPSLSGKVIKKLQPSVPAAGAVVTFYYNDDARFASVPQKTIQQAAASLVGSVNLQQYATQVSQPGFIPGALLKTIVNNPNLLAPTSQPPSAGSKYFSPGMEVNSVAAVHLLSRSVSATTDEDGMFSFTDLPVSDQMIRIEVTLPGHEKVYQANRKEILMRGDHYDITIELDMTIFTVTGAIRDEQNQPISGSDIRWASGGNPLSSDGAGRFIGKNTAGTDTLIISKLGYQKRKIPVTLKEPQPRTEPSRTGTISSAHLTQEAWTSQILSAPSFQLPSSSTTILPLTAAGFGFHTLHAASNSTSQSGNTNTSGTLLSANAQILAPLYTSLIAPDEPLATSFDLDTIVLKKRIGRILVNVIKASDSSAVSNARVKILDTSLEGLTGGDGSWYSEVPGGEVLIHVIPDVETGLISRQYQQLTSDVNITRVTIPLHEGTKVSGTVRGDGQPIADAEVTVENMTHLSSSTNENGKYALVVPKGDFTLKALKTGYKGDESRQNFQGSSQQIDFNLTKPNFDISKLLGFQMEVSKITGDGTRKKISGALVNLPSNGAFTPRPGTKLPFNEIEVDIINNMPVPRGGQITLSLTTLELLAFGYLPVIVKNNDKPLVIQQVAGNVSAGELIGQATILYAKFIPVPLGLELPGGVKHTMSSSSGIENIAVLSSKTGVENFTVFNLKLSDEKATVYSFEARFNKPCTATPDGLVFKGTINLSGAPLLGSASLPLEELVVGKDGAIKRANVGISANTTVPLAGWSANLLSASLHENGIQLSGHIKLKAPQSAESTIGFDNLTVSKTSLYGGMFTLPETGLDLFNIVKMKRGNVPLSFGRIGNSSVHYLGGSGEFNLPKFIDKTIKVDFFQLQTDGKFAAQAPVNFNVPLLGLANISIRNINFRTAGSPGIDVSGDFNLHGIPFFSACAGGIHYGQNGNISFDELGIGFDMVGIARLNAKANFVDITGKQGFEGSGSIQLKSTPLNLDLGFRYYKLTNGIEVGARLRAGVMIPVGFATISDVEGEFNINTQEKKWMGRIGGSLSVVGLNELVAIKPLSITVESGPVFKLEGSMSVIGQRVAKAQGLLDFNRSYFSLDFTQDINFLPELYTTSGGGRVVLSTANNDRYWMMGARYKSSMLGGLVEGNANITAGWGLNVSSHPEHLEYTHFINPTFLSDGRLSGIHVSTSASIDFDTGERGWAGVASGRAWYYNYGAVNMDMGFGSGQYGFRVASGWGGGATLKIMDWEVAGVDVGVDGDITGHYNYSQRHLFLGGNLQGRLAAHINCPGECSSKICWGACFDACDLLGEDCEVCPVPVGGRICVKGGIHASYDTQHGLDIGLDF